MIFPVSILIFGLVSTNLARSPNFKVLIVSEICSDAFEIVRNMTVFAFPDKECCNKRVNFESR